MGELRQVANNGNQIFSNRYRDCQLIDNARNKKLRNIARDVLRIASGEMVDQIERRLMKWTDNYSFH